ncbi:MAG: fumarylacetoacetate hydrolase family protein [Deltaproteobacteria bacterium]|nr:fumarylacetoacetate hydrolase family protein [Deltaproteobacteria bacterium]MBW1861650.1 fumarylacetoacetate hydrolase family protein [Deltaproteobacteria bacterium]
MKFVRFEYKGEVFMGTVKGEEVGVLEGSFLDHYEETGTYYALAEVKLLAPVIPTKIICIAHNYRELIAEIGEEFPEEPVFFLKPPSCLIGPEDDIIYPPGAERVIYEGELALVIKDEMKNVPEDEALNYVLGYSCFNDVTERALIEKNQLFLTLGKGFDTFGPFGPYVVTDLNPNHLELKTYLNGRLMQHDNTRNCIFSVQYILHYLSQVMTLCPGDIISTGTPQGISAIKPGDVLELEIEGIGRLKNVVKTGTE